MSITGYVRTVQAAVSETHSKFSLAEALALDIAPRRGRPAHGETSTDRHLAEARDNIIEAGGEPRSVSTLKSYRQTALWVKNQKTGSFRWIKDRSWSAHDEARQRGLSYGEFAAMPKVRVEVIREVARAEAPPEESAAIMPVTFLPPVPAQREAPPQQDEKLRGDRWNPPDAGRKNGAHAEKPAPSPNRKPSAQQPPRRYNITLALRTVHKSVERIAGEVSVHGIPHGQADAVLAEATWLTAVLVRIMEQAQAQAGRVA